VKNVKTIKDIDETTWATFKSYAAKNNIKLGPFFKMLIEEYETKSEEFWKKILDGKKILSDQEAAALEKTVKAVRKEHGFRK